MKIGGGATSTKHWFEKDKHIKQQVHNINLKDEIY
jgi:hypothetical protein